MTRDVQMERIVALRVEGKPWRQIGDEFGRSAATVRKWFARAALRKNNKQLWDLLTRRQPEP